MYIAAVCTHGIASREGGDRPSTCSIAYHFKLESRLLSQCICVPTSLHMCVCRGGGGGDNNRELIQRFCKLKSPQNLKKTNAHRSSTCSIAFQADYYLTASIRVLCTGKQQPDVHVPIYTCVCALLGQGKTYSIWKLSDLQDADTTVSFFLFGQVYKQLWKMDVGCVIGLLNPSIMDPIEKVFSR